MARIKRHEIPESSAINMTPMMDVIFQLLVFFVLTSTIVRPTQIELQLPDSTTGVKASEDQTLAITYRVREGRPEITLNAKPVAGMAALARSLREVRDKGHQWTVDIRIEKTVPYQDVVDLMDTVRDAGFPKFSLLTMAKGPPAAP